MRDSSSQLFAMTTDGCHSQVSMKKLSSQCLV